MKSAKQFAETAMGYAKGKELRGTPPALLLDRILGNIERIHKLGRVKPAERDEALAIAWEAYAKVLKRVNPEFDESWGGATLLGSSYQQALDIIDDDQLASLVMYGEADDDEL